MLANYSNSDSLRDSLVESNPQNHEVLEQNLGLLSAIIDTTRDAIVVVDSEDLISLWNPAAEKLFGWSKEEAVGMNVQSLVSPETDTSELFPAKTGADTRETFELKGKHKDGEVFPMQVSLSSANLEQNTGTIAMIQDLTEQKKVELYQKLNREVLTILNQTEEFEDLINLLLVTVKQVTECDAVGIRLKRGEDFPFVNHKGFSADFILNENSLIEKDENGGICQNPDGTAKLECTCGLVVSGKTEIDNPLFSPGGSAWTNDSLPLLEIEAKDEPRHNPRNNCVHDGYTSIAIVPIRVREKIIGLLQLNFHKKNQLNLDVINSLEIMANYIGSTFLRKQADKKLLEQEKLNGILEMAGAVCHELNQPLQTALGWAEMLMLDAENLNYDTEALQAIVASTNKLGELTRKISVMEEVKNESN